MSYSFLVVVCALHHEVWVIHGLSPLRLIHRNAVEKFLGEMNFFFLSSLI